MKKLITLTKIIALVLISTVSLQAKVSLEALAAGVEREAAKRSSVYLNDRVKTMCQEWPGCEEWVGLKSANNVSFQLVDTEVAHWINAWSGKDAVWGHRFYAQTRENGQIKAYEFLQTKKGKTSNILHLQK